MKNRKAVFFLLITFLAVLIFFINHWCFKTVDIKGKKFIVELALTQSKKARGLGGRDNLCDSCAMLFDFKEKGQYAFWMKDMAFNLDIIWINYDKIVYIKKDVFYKTLEKINPNVEADKVLEVNAGLAEKYEFRVGDKISIY